MMRQIFLFFIACFLVCSNGFTQLLPESTQNQDKTSPEIQWVSPAPGSFFNQSISVQVQINDESAIETVELQIPDTSNIPLKQDGKFWSLDYTPLQEGQITLAIQAKDVAGNIGKSTPLLVIYDKTPPQGILAYPKQEWYNNNILVIAYTSDNLNYDTRIEFKLNNKEIPSTLVNNNIWQTTINVSKNGIYTLHTTIWDQAGNSFELKDTPNFIIDIEPPQLQINPTKYIFTNQATIRVQAQDFIAGVSQVSVLLHDELITSTNMPEIVIQENPQPQNTTPQLILNKIIPEPIPPETYKLTWDVSKAEEGDYPLVIQAIDNAGNTTEPFNIIMTCDHKPPKVSASITPSHIESGYVHIKLAWEDSSSGIDITSLPKLWVEINKIIYPIAKLSQFSETQGKAMFLVTSAHPQTTAYVYLEGLKDKAGFIVPKTKIGQFSIQTKCSAWPLAPTNRARALLGALDTHCNKEESGIWITARTGEQVYAVEDGKVVEAQLSTANIPGYIYIQRLNDSMVWGYHHLILTENINLDITRPWLPGDFIKAGELIGTIPQVPNSKISYLYLELVTRQNQSWVATSSPINYLYPSADSQRISPLALIQSAKNQPNTASHLQFFVPIEYRLPPDSNLSWVDLLIILYFLLISAILFYLGFLSNSYYYQAKETEGVNQQFWNKFFLLHNAKNHSKSK